jgi:hypothetical protein
MSRVKFEGCFSLGELNGGRKRREEEKREGKGMGLDSLGVGLLTGSGLATVESSSCRWDFDY